MGSSCVRVGNAGSVGDCTGERARRCNLGNGVQHVVVLQFDNVHSERDNPNVPSDLEQMPALRNFLTSNGTLLTNDHTILISHTVNGIVSTETGLYPDRNGVTVGNSYQPGTRSSRRVRRCGRRWSRRSTTSCTPRPSTALRSTRSRPSR
ncbi:MAG: hypothetical protein ACXVVQ_03985 [Solirubrobacteraceae bacterium]